MAGLSPPNLRSAICHMPGRPVGSVDDRGTARARGDADSDGPERVEHRLLGVCPEPVQLPDIFQ